MVLLKVANIDSQRMFEQGEGGKDRYVMLAPQLLRSLRAYWGSLGKMDGCLPAARLASTRP